MPGRLVTDMNLPDLTKIDVPACWKETIIQQKDLTELAKLTALLILMEVGENNPHLIAACREAERTVKRALALRLRLPFKFMAENKADPEKHAAEASAFLSGCAAARQCLGVPV